jgi:hypothetical protein
MNIKEVTMEQSPQVLQPHFVAEKSYKSKSTQEHLDQSTVFNHSKLSNPSSNPTSNIGSYGMPFSNPFLSPAANSWLAGGAGLGGVGFRIWSKILLMIYLILPQSW